MVSEKSKYLFKFYYIGSKEFHGSQRQQNLLTVEESLISSLREGNYIKSIKDSGFEVASRTDKFVSARASAFSFMTKKKTNIDGNQFIFTKNNRCLGNC